METSQVPAKCLRASVSSSTPWARLPSHHSDGPRVVFDTLYSLDDPDYNYFDAQ